MNPADMAALLERTAAAIRAGEVSVPHVSMQFVVTPGAGQDAAVSATAALFPGTEWETRMTCHRAMSPTVHVSGKAGRVGVTISSDAKVKAATIYPLTRGRQAQDSPGSGAAA